MYINTPLLVHGTYKTSAEGISIFDILEQKHVLIPSWGFATSLEQCYAFINLGLMWRLYLYL